MGQTADQIRDEIDNQRMELGGNLQQLERKVKETVDWRAQFEQKPLLGLGMAFGAGVLLSAMLPSGDDKSSSTTSSGNHAYAPYASYAGGNQSDGQRRESHTQPQPSYAASAPKPRSPELNEISQTLDNIKGALLGLGATRLRSFLAEAVPGFHQEYEQARTSRHNSPETRLETAPDVSSSGATSNAALNRSHETQSTYHPDLNTQTLGLDQSAGMPRPSADAFTTQTTSGRPG